MGHEKLDMTLQDLVDLTRREGVLAAALLLREYVDAGEPLSFCGGATSRAMCRLVSLAAEGAPQEKLEEFGAYTDTRYGSDLYRFMWSNDPIEHFDFPAAGDSDG